MTPSLSTGLLFYCDGEQPVEALVVALWTLGRSYRGCVHIVFGPRAPEWLVESIASFQGSLAVSFDRLAKYDFSEWTDGKRGAWCQKPFAIRRSPFDVTLYFDCDHVFLDNDWDEEIWRDVESAGLGTAHDQAAVRRGPKVMRDMKTVVGCDLKHYRPVNGGCVGWLKGHSAMETWIETMSLFVRQRHSPLLRSLAEEYALGFTLNTGRGKWIDASLSRMDYPHRQARAYHLNGRRYVNNPMWRSELEGCIASDFLGIQRNVRKCGGDTRGVFVD